MKYFLLLCFLFFTSSILRAQTTLEFSQVILVDGNTQTVPPNTVWKIEKAVPGNGITKISTTNTSTASAYSGWEMVLNGSSVPLSTVVETLATGYSGSTSCQNATFNFIDQSLFPMWIPAGATLAASTGVQYLSVIEFNVVP